MTDLLTWLSHHWPGVTVELVCGVMFVFVLREMWRVATQLKEDRNHE